MEIQREDVGAKDQRTRRSWYRKVKYPGMASLGLAPPVSAAKYPFILCLCLSITLNYRNNGQKRQAPTQPFDICYRFLGRSVTLVRYLTSTALWRVDRRDQAGEDRNLFKGQGPFSHRADIQALFMVVDLSKTLTSQNVATETSCCLPHNNKMNSHPRLPAVNFMVFRSHLALFFIFSFATWLCRLYLGISVQTFDKAPCDWQVPVVPGILSSPFMQAAQIRIPR